MCKIKSARYVRGMMSVGPAIRLRGACQSRSFEGRKCVVAAQKELDRQRVCDMIVFTHAYGRFTAVKKKPAAPTGHAQSAASSRPARSLQGQRVFRPRRSAAGQIRDAPGGRGRQSSPVSQAAKAFGFSRPSFYQAQAAFEQAGLAGLLPQKRGPRSGHKLTPELMSFVAQLRVAEPSISSSQLADELQSVSASRFTRAASTGSCGIKKTPVSAEPAVVSVEDAGSSPRTRNSGAGRRQDGGADRDSR